MYIILWLFFGAFVGWIASLIMSKNYSMGLVGNILIGIIGSALGMWLMEIFGFGRPDAFTFPGFLISVGGASLLIAILSAIKHNL
ncbi:GlsB/YeaQ/YmgE family stress response membrane protein [Methanobacterium sp. YSL]|nr:GlsB/YeaQ/YmgE family stress response membrane protein [Methanobacterium sp. YSL]